MKKKQIEQKIDYKLEFAKSNLEHEKGIYQNYIDCIVKYDKELAVGVIRAEDMKDGAMKSLMEYCQKNNKSFVQVAFRDNIYKDMKSFDQMTEVEKLEGETKYYKNLNKWAKTITNMFDVPTKEQMAKDLISNMIAWNTFFDDLSKISKGADLQDKTNKTK